jgi:hypothetical protein
MFDTMEPPRKTPSERLKEICATEWARHQFDRHEFANAVTKRIVTGEDFELIRLAVFKAAVIEHKHLAHAENERLLHLPTEATEPELQADEKVVDVSLLRQQAAFERKNAARSSIFEWRWGVGCMPIGEMTRDMLLRIAETEERKANNTLAKCRFVRRVADLLPDDKKVSEVLQEDVIEKIRDEIFGQRSAA